MTTREILEQLCRLTPGERLEIAEAAMRLTREELASSGDRKLDQDDEDAVLDIAGCLSGNPLSAAEIERQLYGE